MMRFDTQALHFLNLGLVSGPMDALMLLLTLLALPGIGLLGLHWHRRGQKREAWALWMITALSTLLAVLLQFTLLRPRPLAVRALVEAPPFPAFPSGHAMSCFAAAVFVGLIKRGWAAGALALASMVALSRIYLGHHFPSDVLIGAILGAGVGAVGYGAFYQRSREARPRWAWWFWPQLALVLFAGFGAYLRLLKIPALQLPYADKVLHFSLYGALAFLLVGWFARRSPWVVLSVLSVLAVIDEALQALSPARTFDPVDLVCTLAGILLLGVAGRWAVRRDRPAVPTLVLS